MYSVESSLNERFVTGARSSVKIVLSVCHNFFTIQFSVLFFMSNNLFAGFLRHTLHFCFLLDWLYSYMGAFNLEHFWGFFLIEVTGWSRFCVHCAGSLSMEREVESVFSLLSPVCLFSLCGILLATSCMESFQRRGSPFFGKDTELFCILVCFFQTQILFCLLVLYVVWRVLNVSNSWKIYKKTPLQS